MLVKDRLLQNFTFSTVSEYHCHHDSLQSLDECGKTFHCFLKNSSFIGPWKQLLNGTDHQDKFWMKFIVPNRKRMASHNHSSPTHLSPDSWLKDEFCKNQIGVKPKLVYPLVN